MWGIARKGSDARQRRLMTGSSRAHHHVRHTAPFALLAAMVPDIVKRALLTKGFGGKCRSTGDGPLHLVDVAVSDFRFWRHNGHPKCYGGFKPHPSLWMLRHPLAGHALGFGNQVGGHQ